MKRMRNDTIDQQLTASTTRDGKHNKQVMGRKEGVSRERKEGSGVEREN